MTGRGVNLRLRTLHPGAASFRSSLIAGEAKSRGEALKAWAGTMALRGKALLLGA